jgi:hypothetical protein
MKLATKHCLQLVSTDRSCKAARAARLKRVGAARAHPKIMAFKEAPSIF